jgi:methionine-gamma-lyase
VGTRGARSSGASARLRVGVRVRNQGGEAEAFQLLNRLQLIKLAIGFGGTESVIEHPATMTHADLVQERQHELGITPGMLRLSVGIEHPDDLVADLAQALEEA